MGGIVKMSYYAVMGLTIISMVGYHIVQKNIPPTIHPLIALTVTYLVAALICLLLLPLMPITTPWSQIGQHLHWSSVALAVGVVGIEVGFLLAYRIGWEISTAALISNVAVTIVLIPIGVLFFRERFSITQIVGLGLCVVGLLLIRPSQ
jgi:drug/metabolite transporter (DMT)-like permease